MIARFVPGSSTNKAFTAPVNDISPEDFVSAGGVKPFYGANVGQLLHFIRINHYRVHPWSPAHVAIMQAIAVLVSDAEAQIKKIRERSQAIRAELFRTWQPPEFEPVEDGGN